ncbi:MAG: hypothetical protein IJC84_00450 [Clostridia bacterium]|nr:hypothetical protein [Clostridia bacterium]
MEPKQYPLKGGLFPLIALLLALLAMVGLFSVLRPEAALLDAAGESLEELEERDETLLRLVSLLRTGRLVATEKGKEVLTVTGDGETRCLTLRGETRLSLYRSGDELILKPEEGEVTGGKADAFFPWLATLTDPELRLLLGAFVTWTDPRLTNDALLAECEALFEAAEPTLTKEKTDFSHGEEEGSAELYLLSAEGETAAGAVALLKELRSDAALLQLLASLAEENGARREAIASFFAGEGDFYEAVAKDPSLTAELTVFDGLLRRADMTLKGKDAALALSLTLDGTASGMVITATHGEAVSSLALTDSVTEDDRSYLREIGITLTENGEARETRIRFSWGKSKNDLALRLTLTDTEYYFRGTLDENKKSRVIFTLSRIEKDKENILPLPLQFTLTDEEEALTLPDKDADFSAPAAEGEAQ